MNNNSTNNEINSLNNLNNDNIEFLDQEENIVSNSNNTALNTSINNDPNEVDNKVQYEEVEVEKFVKEVRVDSYFDGTLLELIGWNILRFLITIVTIGIAGPWGSCMYYRFIVGHTVLNGKRMKFVGNGGDYFVQKFKWVFFTIITLGIYAFWIPIKDTKWIINHIHFEDEEYKVEESFFDGKLIQLIGINILCGFLTIISFGILYPFTLCLKQRWLAKHTIINRKKIVFNGKALNLIGHYLLWLLLTIITFGIYGLWLNIKLIKWEVKNTHIKLAGEEELKENPISIIIILIIAIFGIIIISNILKNIDINDFENFGNQSSVQNVQDTNYNGILK